MASTIASALMFGLIGASIVLPLLKKLPAWGAIVLANVAIHLVAFATPTIAPFLSIHELTYEWTFDLAEFKAGTLHGYLGLLTSMYLHAGFMHLFGNMLILGFLGYHLEERISPRTFLAAYLLTGLAGSVASMAVEWDSIHYRALGASGAVFGMLGVLGAAFPMQRFLLPISVGIILFRRIKGWMATIIGGATELVFLWISGALTNIGHWAHLGGLVAGIIFGLFLYPRVQAKAGDKVETPDTLEQFANTRRAKDALAHLRASQDEPDVHAVWMDRFRVEATCPKCGGPLEQGRHGLSCATCRV